MNRDHTRVCPVATRRFPASENPGEKIGDTRAYKGGSRDQRSNLVIRTLALVFRMRSHKCQFQRTDSSIFALKKKKTKHRQCDSAFEFCLQPLWDLRKGRSRCSRLSTKRRALESRLAVRLSLLRVRFSLLLFATQFKRSPLFVLFRRLAGVPGFLCRVPDLRCVVFWRHGATRPRGRRQTGGSLTGRFHEATGPCGPVGLKKYPNPFGISCLYVGWFLGHESVVGQSHSSAQHTI